MRSLTIAGMICAGLLLNLSGCRTKPEPCNCGLAERELTVYTQKYFDALEDVGNLRQQVKACKENK